MEHVGVIGIGKLGLCFALNLEAAGYQVTGMDANAEYVAQVNAKSLKSHEPEVETMLAAAQNFSATTALAEIVKNEEIKLMFIVVATPSLEDGGYDHSQVDGVLDAITTLGMSKTARHLVVMCTTLPGYCDTAGEKMENLGYTLSYNPEFIAQGSIIRDQQYPDQILIGENFAEAGDAIEAVYRKMCKNEPTFCRMSRISAEITKLATNCFLTTKISFANSIGDLALKVGGEPDKILAAIGADDRIGSKYLNYGFGYGGPCFPRDNRALAHYGRKNDLNLLLSEATDEVNRRHLDFQVKLLMDQTDKKEPFRFSSVTYKRGTTILEESQQLALAVELARAGRKVIITEHPDVVAQLRKEYGDLMQYHESKGETGS